MNAADLIKRTALNLPDFTPLSPEQVRSIKSRDCRMTDLMIKHGAVHYMAGGAMECKASKETLDAVYAELDSMRTVAPVAQVVTVDEPARPEPGSLVSGLNGRCYVAR